MNIHIHIHHCDDGNDITLKLNKIMGQLEDFNAKLDRIDAATNNIAEDLRNLKDEISTGLTAPEVTALQDRLETTAAKLEGIAASTEDVTPDNPPSTP